MRELFRISVLFVLGQPLYKAVTRHAMRIRDIHLRLDVTGIYLQRTSVGGNSRTHACKFVVKRYDRCQSFNRVIYLLKCEFSNFISNPDRSYHKRNRKRGKKKNCSKFIMNNCDDLLGSKLRSLKSFKSNLDDRVSEIRLFLITK